MTLSQREAVRLVEAHVAASKQVRARVLAALLARWDRLGGWRDDDAEAFVAFAAPLVEAGQRQTAALARLWLARMIETPADVNFDAAISGRGVDKQQVYQRPFVDVRRFIAQGEDIAVAVDRGRTRLQSLAATDMQMAKVRASRDVIDNAPERVQGYRRVLTGQSSCGLCSVAASQRYRKEDLLPIHPGCDCDVAPIVGATDPGQVIDERLLDGTHAAIEERFGTASRDARDIDYRKVIVTHEHGEIGPVLTLKEHQFTGPTDF